MTLLDTLPAPYATAVRSLLAEPTLTIAAITDWLRAGDPNRYFPACASNDCLVAAYLQDQLAPSVTDAGIVVSVNIGSFAVLLLQHDFAGRRREGVLGRARFNAAIYQLIRLFDTRPTKPGAPVTRSNTGLYATEVLALIADHKEYLTDVEV